MTITLEERTLETPYVETSKIKLPLAKTLNGREELRYNLIRQGDQGEKYRSRLEKYSLDCGESFKKENVDLLKHVLKKRINWSDRLDLARILIDEQLKIESEDDIAKLTKIQDQLADQYANGYLKKLTSKKRKNNFAYSGQRTTNARRLSYRIEDLNQMLEDKIYKFRETKRLKNLEEEKARIEAQAEQEKIRQITLDKNISEYQVGRKKIRNPVPEDERIFIYDKGRRIESQNLESAARTNVFSKIRNWYLTKLTPKPYIFEGSANSVRKMIGAFLDENTNASISNLIKKRNGDLSVVLRKSDPYTFSYLKDIKPRTQTPELSYQRLAA